MSTATETAPAATFTTRKMPKGFCPPGVFTLAIEDVDQSKSKSGHPMDKITVHIVAPETAYVKNGNIVEEYSVGGLKSFIYMCYIDNGFFPANCEALRKLGVAIPDEGDFATTVAAIQSQTKEWKRPYVKGMPGQSLYVFEAAVTSDVRYATLPLNLADIAAGKDVGQLALDAQGKPIPMGANLEVRPIGIIGNLRDSQLPF